METKTETSLTDSGQDKTIAIIAYLTLIGLVIAFVMNSEKKHEFASFHIRQSLGLMLTGFVVSFINIIPILGQIIWLIAAVGLLIFWIMGLMNAINHKQKPLPILGDKYAQWFKGI
ncbi:hypothetical protein GCM10009117_20410 [Gangjinia marincola]|uniref:Uncharacterized protein n=1 Tax=Gangjinia marincola TaxID=578463 RepID=A0ABN1MIW8_9FLAO